MAKKKPQGKGKKQTGRRGKRDDALAKLLIDRRTVEAVMREAFGDVLGGPVNDPEARAQDLVGQAIESPPARQVKLARQALDIFADCADAYVLLAENAESLADARELHAEGMAAGERALGFVIFEARKRLRLAQWTAQSKSRCRNR